MKNSRPERSSLSVFTESPMGMVLIPPGEFSMGSEIGSEVEKPIHRIYLDAYFIDIAPVSNAQFSTFVAATGFQTDAERPRDHPSTLLPPGISWRTFATPDRENHPVLLVSWDDASAYAQWCGKRLPTEAEWERAARGGIERQSFPWGAQAPNDAHLNWRKSQPNHAAPPPTTPTKSYPANGFGLYDVVGNVWEWCSDWYADSYYAGCPYRNPQGPDQGHFRVRRGGSWNVEAEFRVRCATRGAMLPNQAWPNLGFRCVLGYPS